MADDIQAQLKKAAGAAKGSTSSDETGILHKQLSNIQQEMTEKGVEREAKEKGENYVSLLSIPLRADFLHLLTREEISEGQLVVFDKKGKELHVACVDPNIPETKNVLDSLTQKGYTTLVFLASKEGIERALSVYEVGEASKKIELSTKLSEDDKGTMQDLKEESFAELASKIQGLPSAEAVNMIELMAVQLGVSDVHIEPTEKDAILRFRIDGVLRKIFDIPKKQFEQMATQLKHDADLKINVRDVPQDGESSFVFEGRSVRVRMSTLPTENGESLVLRILDSKNALTEFDALGFEQGNLADFEKALRISYGMILVTGPTGSGKTTTLYTALRHMSTSENKVITLEDPMEYALPGIVQSEVHEEEGYSFADGLKSILRQDPDIIMIGEIRDLPSAETSAQAALTGHVVLSTLHTNSALEGIPRLLNMGVKPFVLAPALHAIMGQRLVRTVCEHCKAERAISDSEKQELEKALPRIQKVRPQGGYELPTKVYEGKGCEECHHTGFLGRTVITEVILLDEELRNLISSNISSQELEKKVLEERDILFMKEDGIIKVLEGRTTLAEVLQAVG